MKQPGLELLLKLGWLRPCFVAGPPQGKNSPSGMSLDTQQSIVDCCVPSESERHTSREVERKPKAQRGGFFCRRSISAFKILQPA